MTNTGTYYLLRPDQHVAARWRELRPERVIACLRRALGHEPCPGKRARGMKSDLNIADPDGFYEALIALHEGLSDEESNLLNARLVLLLANQMGDMAVLRECLAAARALRPRD